jgi:hypothetical protein
MTSPVDTTVKHFFSSMVGAPVLTKQAGSLIALLDALLVLGFDSKPATSLKVAGGVATLEFAGAHSATLHSVVLVSGVEAPYQALNGEQKVTAIANGKVSFATTANAGTATGSIVFKMAPAGWIKAFAAGNVAVYKSADPMSNGMFLRVDDTGNTMAGVGFARVRGYVSMSDVNTGTGPFPLNEQMQEDNANGAFWPKGYTQPEGTTPIGWSFYADTRIFYYAPMLYQSQIDPASQSYARYIASHLDGFGDLRPYRPGGDPWATSISAHLTISGAQSYVEAGSFSGGYDYQGGNFAARRFDGTGQAERGIVWTYGQKSQNAPSGQATSEYGRFPSQIDGSLTYAPRYWRTYQYVDENSPAPRAEVPGLMGIPMSGVFPALGKNAILDGEGRWAGRKLYGHVVGNPSTDTVNSPEACGVLLVDLTGPWR